MSHAAAGNIDLPLLLVLLVGGTLGAQLGQQLCDRLSGARLRRYFCYVVLAVVLLVLAELIGILF
ncbi:MAG: TSUP family transporter [Chloroflexi bacterium]|nr:TSUP family transporter [Chloroflexota bacterium]